MPRSLPNKLEYAKQLLQIDIPYRDIQSILKEKYGSGLSNKTLQNIKSELIDLDAIYEELKELRKLIPLIDENRILKKDLEMYKTMYMEIFETVKERLQSKSL